MEICSEKEKEDPKSSNVKVNNSSIQDINPIDQDKGMKNCSVKGKESMVESIPSVNSQDISGNSITEDSYTSWMVVKNKFGKKFQGKQISNPKKQSQDFKNTDKEVKNQNVVTKDQEKVVNSSAQKGSQPQQLEKSNVNLSSPKSLSAKVVGENGTSSSAKDPSSSLASGKWKEESKPKSREPQVIKSNKDQSQVQKIRNQKGGKNPQKSDKGKGLRVN